MAVTLFFWRDLKGPRVKVLLNLCAAIACSCILAILEGSARNEEVCKILQVEMQQAGTIRRIDYANATISPSPSKEYSFHPIINLLNSIQNSLIY